MEAIESLMGNKAAGFVKTMAEERSQEAAKAEEKRTPASRENRQTVGKITVENPRMTCRDVNVYYGEKHAIRNVFLGPRIHGLAPNKAELDEVVETSLRKTGLWDEVKDIRSISLCGLKNY